MHMGELRYEKIFRLLLGLREHSEATYFHSIRVANMANELYKLSGLPQNIKEDVIIGALLHDIGKSQIPIEILDKKEKLTNEEWMLLMQHPIIGISILDDYSEIVKNICQLHHKKNDNSGYPDGYYSLPEYVKYITVLDIYDALSHKRPYKEIMSDGDTLKFLRQESSEGVLEQKYVSLLSYIPYASAIF